MWWCHTPEWSGISCLMHALSVWNCEMYEDIHGYTGILQTTIGNDDKAKGISQFDSRRPIDHTHQGWSHSGDATTNRFRFSLDFKKELRGTLVYKQGKHWWCCPSHGPHILPWISRFYFRAHWNHEALLIYILLLSLDKNLGLLPGVCWSGVHTVFQAATNCLCPTMGAIWRQRLGKIAEGTTATTKQSVWRCHDCIWLFQINWGSCSLGSVPNQTNSIQYSK